MQIIIIISAIMASVAAAPAYYLAEEPHVYHAVPLKSKSTFTYNSQVIDHGSTFVHSPIVHTPIVHTPVVSLAHSKTTITKANQIVNHGGSTVYHPVHTYGVMSVHSPIVPVVHAPVVHAPVVYHSSPLLTLKTGDSAITHQSSTVHETVPVVKSLSYVPVHH